MRAQTNSSCAGIDVSKIEPYKASRYQQFIGCLWRSWKSIIKEPAIIRIRVIQNIVSRIWVIILGKLYSSAI